MSVAWANIHYVVLHFTRSSAGLAFVIDAFELLFAVLDEQQLRTAKRVEGRRPRAKT